MRGGDKEQLKRLIEADLPNVMCDWWNEPRLIPFAEERLFDNTYKYLSTYGFSWLRRSSPRIADFDELLADAMCRAFENFLSFNGRTASEFLGWVFSLARSAWAKNFRAQGRQKQAHPVAAEPLASTDYSPSQFMERADRWHVIHYALMKMPAKYAAVLDLQYFEDKSIYDIAYDLGLKTGTVKTRLRRGRVELKKTLRRMGYDRELLLG